MKKLFYCFALMLGCFAATDEVDLKNPNQQEEPKESRTGWFFGVGIGGGWDQMEITEYNPNSQSSLYLKKNSTIFVGAAKAGGYHYFSKWIATRYYYNLDWIFHFGEDASTPLHFNNSIKKGYSINYTSHTLNVDFIFNAYSGEKYEFGFISGIGAGVSVGSYNQKDYTIIWYYNEAKQTFVNYDLRVNAGMRLMVDKKYGLELLAKVPLLPAQIYDQLNHSNQNWTSIAYLPYSFSLDFVMEF